MCRIFPHVCSHAVGNKYKSTLLLLVFEICIWRLTYQIYQTRHEEPLETCCHSPVLEFGEKEAKEGRELKNI